MIISVKKFGREYRVVIKQDHQSFILDYTTNTKDKCLWLAKMFRIALKRHNEKLLKNLSK